MNAPLLRSDTQQLQRDVERALAEDVGDGDITAELLPAESHAEGRIVTREAGR